MKQGLERGTQASFDGHLELVPQRARSSLHPSEYDLQVADDCRVRTELNGC